MVAAPAPRDVNATIAEHLEKGQYTEAFEKSRLLAERGSTTAQVFVGWMYQVGRGVKKDLEEAGRWYKNAADAGFAEGQFYLGRLHLDRGNYQEAIHWIVKAASQNHMPALFRLADLYDVGEGVHVDREKAYQLFEQAAKMGHVFAQKEIAVKMIKGHFGIMRIPEGFHNLARALWSGCRLTWKDPYSDRLRR